MQVTAHAYTGIIDYIFIISFVVRNAFSFVTININSLMEEKKTNVVHFLVG
jgi:hypothetical protein